MVFGGISMSKKALGEAFLVMSNEYGYFYWAKIYSSNVTTQYEEIIDISIYDDMNIYAMGISK